MIRLLQVFAGSVALLMALTGAHAGMINLGGGWEASWDSSLDSYLTITSNGVSGDAVIIEKSVEFFQGPVLGIFPAVSVTFTQNDPNAVGNIVIDDEAIKNSTGVDWIDFHFELLDGPDAAFDPNATAASGGGGPIGWTISPYNQAAFSSGDTKLDVWDGLVADGTSWYPGDGATDGQLWINVVTQSSEPYTTFVLKERPTPEPATLSLLALGACLPLLRKRRG